MIETSSVPPRNSSATFGNLRKMFGECSETFTKPLEQFGKIFENLRKVVGNLRDVLKNIVIRNWVERGIGSSGRCEWTCFAELHDARGFFKMKITQYE